MTKPKVITVGTREMDRLKTVQAVMDGQLRRGGLPNDWRPLMGNYGGF